MVVRTEAPKVRELPDLLHNGDHLKQPEFHELYKQYPDDVKIELIGGIVYMASPAKAIHGNRASDIGTLLWLYCEGTPGVDTALDITTILGEESEPQPDLNLYVMPEWGGRVSLNEDGYLVGAPELIVEVALSSRAIDLGAKRDDYQSAGAIEYLVFDVRSRQITWFDFTSDNHIKPDAKGVWKSRVFPGLWIDGPALADRQRPQMSATLRAGLASRAHAAFVKRLAARRGT